MKSIFALLVTGLALVLCANDGLKIPSWIQVRENGNLIIDKINCYFGVTDFKKGNDDYGSASRFLCPVSTIELDSRIWRSVLTPYSDPDYKVTVDKKLSVLSGDTVAWRNSFTANKPKVIRGSMVTFSLPPEPFDLVIDGKRLRFGKKYDPKAYFRGPCKRVVILTSGIARKPGQTRLDLAKTNVSIIKSITRSTARRMVFQINLVLPLRLFFSAGDSCSFLLTDFSFLKDTGDGNPDGSIPISS